VWLEKVEWTVEIRPEQLLRTDKSSRRWSFPNAMLLTQFVTTFKGTYCDSSTWPTLMGLLMAVCDQPHCARHRGQSAKFFPPQSGASVMQKLLDEDQVTFAWGE
jgi:hypothetical protein